MYPIWETFVFQTEIYTFRIFIPSLCCFFFLSSPWRSVCSCCFLFFFFFTRSTRTCRCHSKWSFCGSSVFLVVKNLHDLRSQIRFWILPKKRRHPICFREGCSVQSSLLPPPYWKTRRPCGQGWTFYVDIHRNIAKGMMAVSVWSRF